MKVTVSGIAGRSELGTGEACEKSMKALVLFLWAVVLAGLPGCLSFGFGAATTPTRRLPRTSQRTRSTEKWRKWSSSIEYAFRKMRIIR